MPLVLTQNLAGIEQLHLILALPFIGSLGRGGAEHGAIAGTASALKPQLKDTASRTMAMNARRPAGTCRCPG